MYDIKWIRDNADLFDKGRERRGLDPLSAHLLALDEARPRGHRAIAAGAGAAQRGLEGDRGGDEGGGFGEG